MHHIRKHLNINKQTQGLQQWQDACRTQCMDHDCPAWLMARSTNKMQRSAPYLYLLGPQVGEATLQQHGQLSVHKCGIVGVGPHAPLRCVDVPKGRTDGLAAGQAKQVVQDACLQLEAWLVHGVCTQQHRRVKECSEGTCRCHQLQLFWGKKAMTICRDLW